MWEDIVATYNNSALLVRIKLGQLCVGSSGVHCGPNAPYYPEEKAECQERCSRGHHGYEPSVCVCEHVRMCT